MLFLSSVVIQLSLLWSQVKITEIIALKKVRYQFSVGDGDEEKPN